MWMWLVFLALFAAAIPSLSRKQYDQKIFFFREMALALASGPLRGAGRTVAITGPVGRINPQFFFI